MTSLRFGLVGTGHWARIAHAPALATTEGVELTAVWGRNQQATAELAAGHRAAAYHDFTAFLAAVDAVCFAVPPDVQAPMAIQAAQAGKHLLLEKPIALSDDAADELAETIGQAAVASVVFFTQRFTPEMRAWLSQVTALGGWSGGGAIWLGSALRAGNPFNTPWRNERGGLWDVGPHLISLLWASLGPVTAVTAEAGLADVTHLILHHEGGASSTVTATLSAPENAARFEAYVWGAAGRSAAPGNDPDQVAALRTALAELAANARSGQIRHACDVWFGREVGRVLTEAQRQLDAKRSGPA